MSLPAMSIDILHYLLRFLNPLDLCNLNQVSLLWKSLTDQDVIWRALSNDRWKIDLERDPKEMEIKLQQNDYSISNIWKNIYKEKYIELQKYKPLLAKVNENLFAQIRSSYSVEQGEYIWEKLDAVTSIRSKPVHNPNVSNPEASNNTNPNDFEIWKGVPSDEYFSRQNYTHYAVYVTKLCFGVPYEDAIKIIEEVEMRPEWDEQMLQGWTLRRLARDTDIVYLLFEGMELLLLRQQHERRCTDGKRITIFGQVTPGQDELDAEIKRDISEKIRSYYEDDEEIDTLTRINEQQGSGWCVEEVDPAQNIIRISYQVRVPPEKAWENGLLFMAQASARAACLPRLEEYYHTKYVKRKLQETS